MLAPGQQRPDRAGMLVGYRDRRDILVAALNQGIDPAAVRIVVPGGRLHAGPGAMNQERPQIGITAFADAEQLGFAAARSLARDQPQPGGYLTAIREGLAITPLRQNSCRL